MTWQASAGTISAIGLYTPPATVTTPLTVTITATSVADTGKTGTATLTVNPASAFTVTPATVTLSGGASQTFTTTPAVAVNWSVSSGTGSITAAGVYTAPAVTACGATATVNLSATGGLPAPWVQTDVGPTNGVAGTGTYDCPSATFTMTGLGTDTFGLPNGFNYVHRTLYGDGTIIGRLASFANAAQFSKFGLMMRAGAGPTDPYVYLHIQPNNGGVTVGIGPSSTQSPGNYFTTGGPQPWMKIVRTGNNFGLFTSSDGVTWVNVNNTTLGLPSALEVGMAITSVSGNVLSSTFDNVSVAQSTVNLSIAPATSTLHPGQIEQLALTANGAPVASANWTLTPSLGTISAAGVYTAPTLASLQTVTVKAMLPGDAVDSATATINVYPPVSISVNPTTVTLAAQQTQQFTGAVSGDPNTSVRWTVSPAGTGTISPAGLYKAPSQIVAGQTVIVTAISNADGVSNATATVALTVPASRLTLSTLISGPEPVGATQKLVATLRNLNGTPISNATVQFTVAGANATTLSGTTNGFGDALVQYVGTHAGADTAQAVASGTYSNALNLSWIVPLKPVTTSSILGRFYAATDLTPQLQNQTVLPTITTVFDPTATPLFTQNFPVINFNPPPNAITGISGLADTNSRPFTNVITDFAGTQVGTIVAQGNGYLAGGNGQNPAATPLYTFRAIFTGQMTIAAAGNVTFDLFADDGYILSFGNGATTVAGDPMSNSPGKSPLMGYPVMGAVNNGEPPTGSQVTVNFPAPGVYPYELDYFECCDGQLALTMAVVPVGGGTPGNLPPTGSVVVTPTLLSGNTGTTQTVTATVTDAGGNAVPGMLVQLGTTGANPQQLAGTTDATGKVVFSYAGAVGGTDVAQAVATVAGSTLYSNMVAIVWNGGVPVSIPVIRLTSSVSVPQLVGNTQTLSATVLDATGAVVAGVPVTVASNGSGVASLTYTGTNAGLDSAQASAVPRYFARDWPEACPTGAFTDLENK